MPSRIAAPVPSITETKESSSQQVELTNIPREIHSGSAVDNHQNFCKNGPNLPSLQGAAAKGIFNHLGHVVSPVPPLCEETSHWQLNIEIVLYGIA